MLNQFQQEAVYSDIHSPLCIVAGPGSGKTKTIIERVRFIQSQTNQLDQILILAFSKSAVMEMKSRLQIQQETSSLNPQTIHIFTFHSLGYKVISTYWNLLGFTKLPKKCSPKLSLATLKVNCIII